MQTVYGYIAGMRQNTTIPPSYFQACELPNQHGRK
jgi:hypothetical protein